MATQQNVKNRSKTKKGKCVKTIVCGNTINEELINSGDNCNLDPSCSVTRTKSNKLVNNSSEPNIKNCDKDSLICGKSVHDNPQIEDIDEKSSSNGTLSKSKKQRLRKRKRLLESNTSDITVTKPIDEYKHVVEANININNPSTNSSGIHNITKTQSNLKYVTKTDQEYRKLFNLNNKSDIPTSSRTQADEIIPKRENVVAYINKHHTLDKLKQATDETCFNRDNPSVMRGLNSPCVDLIKNRNITKTQSHFNNVVKTDQNYNKLPVRNSKLFNLNDKSDNDTPTTSKTGNEESVEAYLKKYNDIKKHAKMLKELCSKPRANILKSGRSRAF